METPKCFEAFWEEHSYLSEAHANIIYEELSSLQNKYENQNSTTGEFLLRLYNASLHYRTYHDNFGDADIRTGMAWDSLRKQEEATGAFLLARARR